MPKYITAVEAARRLGVNEKTVRSWVQSGKLDAHKVVKNRLAILASDVESLRRKREGYQDDSSDIALLAARLEDLERKYADLEQKYRELSSAMAERVVSKDESQHVMSGAVLTLPVQKRAIEESASVPIDIPDGSMLFADFAAMYGVDRTTFRRHCTSGIQGDCVETIERPKPGGRKGDIERWLTPDQQRAALAFWDRHRVKYWKPSDV